MKPHYNFACLKFGSKYTEADVNRLYNCIDRFINTSFTLYCITDNSEKINENVKIIDLDTSLDIEGCMWKLCLFNVFVGKNIPIVYFDLDVIVHNNPIPLFDKLQRNKITVCSRAQAGEDTRKEINEFLYPTFFNSSMIGFYSDDMKFIYDEFISNSDYYQVKYQGADDRFVGNVFKDCYVFFNFKRDYYFRIISTAWDPDGHISWVVNEKSNILHKVVYDPEKIVCIITNAFPGLYKGLEEYFI